MKALIKGIALLFLPLFLTPLHAEEKLTGITLEWEPYIGSKLPQEGYVGQIVREAFAAGGDYSLQIEYMAWAWVTALAGSGRYHFYFPEYYDAKLEQNFLLSDPIPGGPLVFFKKKDKPIAFTRLEDLKPYKIGVVRGYVNTEAFDAATYLNKEEAIQDSQNLAKLLAGGIDLMVVDKYVGLHLLRAQAPHRVQEVEILHPPLDTKNLFVCFPKNVANAEAHRQAFNQGLKTLTESGRIKEIMASHGF